MLPEKFKEEAKALFDKDDEYELFISTLEECDNVRALRINSLKTDKRSTDLPFELSEISYASDGFIIESSDGIGNTAEHHSGMIYVQDPGAMAPMNSLDIKEGAWICDLCSAPGGKSAQAAARLSGTGFLLSNEYVPKRAKITVQNFERLGIKNAIVTSLDTAVISELFTEVFDLVIADAPCSAEGMFRKSAEAISEWSEDVVKNCAARQKEILKNARNLVRDGGYLLYSTCTYSLLENEMVVDEFLSENPDYELVPVKDELSRVTCDGIEFNGHTAKNLKYTRRFYPHVTRGEGQFLALMRKSTKSSERSSINYKDASVAPTKEESRIIEEFFSKNLIERPFGRVRRVNENLVLIAHDCPIMPRSVFSAGVLIGNIEKGILFPSHQFFSAYGNLFKRQLILDEHDERLSKYLRGEEIDASEICGSGYTAVLYKDAPLGGGKLSGGRLKNHYPKGLRAK